MFAGNRVSKESAVKDHLLRIVRGPISQVRLCQLEGPHFQQIRMEFSKEGVFVSNTIERAEYRFRVARCTYPAIRLRVLENDGEGETRT